MSDALREEIAYNVKRLRTEAGYTQDEVAQRIGITWRNYQKYEKAGAVPRPENLEKLAKVYGVSVEEILGQTPGPKGKDASIANLTRHLAVLQGQVDDLIAWKRDQETRNRRIDVFMDSQEIELEA